MLQKLGQKYPQKFFRTEQLSPPLKRFQVYPQTLDEIDQENEIFLDFKTAKEEQYGGWFSTGMFGIIVTAICVAVIIPFNEHLSAIEKLYGFVLGLLVLLILIRIPGVIELLSPLPAPWRFNRRTREVYALDESGPLYHAL